MSEGVSAKQLAYGTLAHALLTLSELHGLSCPYTMVVALHLAGSSLQSQVPAASCPPLSASRLDEPLSGTPRGRFDSSRSCKWACVSAQVQVWDTAGQERFRKSMVKHYYHNVHAVVFVYDVTNMTSFCNLQTWIEVCQMFPPFI